MDRAVESVLTFRDLLTLGTLLTGMIAIFLRIQSVRSKDLDTIFARIDAVKTAAATHGEVEQGIGAVIRSNEARWQGHESVVKAQVELFTDKIDGVRRAVEELREKREEDQRQRHELFKMVLDRLNTVAAHQRAGGGKDGP